MEQGIFPAETGNSFRITGNFKVTTGNTQTDAQIVDETGLRA
jgi:hypothetical protein